MVRKTRGLVALLGGVGITVAACRSPAPPPAASATPAPVAAPAPPATPAVGLYVSNETSGDLTIIDANTLTVVATEKLGKRPRGLKVSPDGTRLYVALSGSPIGGPGVDEKTLPPADKSADGIGVFDLAQGKLLKVLPSGSDPETVAVSADGTQVFVANEDAALASIVDVADGKIAYTFKIGEDPEGTGVTPDGKQPTALGHVRGRRHGVHH